MNIRIAVSYRILKLCREKNLTVNGLAIISAVPPSTLKNIINGGSLNPGIVTIKKICDGLGMTVAEFFDADVFRRLDQEIV